jgi:hypothetical protein
MNEAKPINPQRVSWELSPRLPDECILTCDCGSAANWYARDLKIRRGMMASLSGGLATMGPAVPYAIAAKYAHPGRHVIALLGDGSMQMNGMNALITRSASARREHERREGNPERCERRQRAQQHVDARDEGILPAGSGAPAAVIDEPCSEEDRKRQGRGGYHPGHQAFAD